MWNKDNSRNTFLSLSTICQRVKRSKGWLSPARFFKRTGTERCLFVEAFCLLAVARLAILLVPFRQIAPWLGQVMAESPRHAPEGEALARRISWAVATAARCTPWQSKCLAQAMAAKMMLKRCGVPSTLYLGLAKDAAAGLNAHAWLRCGEQILTGGPGHREYTVIACFADTRP